MDGNAVSALTLGSHGCWSTACPKASPFKSGCSCTHLSASTTCSGTWTLPESATQANPDTGQSALPTAATGHESVAGRTAPAEAGSPQTAWILARLDTPPGS